MTTKEIAAAVGKTERSVQMWAKKAGEKISSIGEKISSAGHGVSADYTLEETIAIIEAGMGPDAAGIFRANAAPEAKRPKAKAVTGAYLHELTSAYDKSIISRDDWRHLAGLPPMAEAAKQLALPLLFKEQAEGLEFYQGIAEAGGLVNSDKDDLAAMYRGRR